MTFADHIDVFYGRVTHSSAQVYVRVSSLVGGGEWSIAGHVRGPVARGVRTLPATVALTDLGEGATLLASCAIPDPAFWTTQLPGVYELHIDLRRDGEVVETIVRTLGIRFFGASGRHFLWEGKRWVLRGVSTQVSDVEEIDAFQDNAGVIVVKDPTESLLSRASFSGVLLVAELTSGDLLQELRRLSHWPASAIAILPSECDVTKELRAAVPNLLFAERIDLSTAIAPADWTQVVFCDETNQQQLRDALTQMPLPIVAERRLNGGYTLKEARRECDHLQRDLAPLGDFAGYIVQM
ncbi:MAG: hypothetical protein O3C40_16810 [Planctomycetota bacterium]|nr:hypothetical protein [Planctomycetota bacterium]